MSRWIPVVSLVVGAVLGAAIVMILPRPGAALPSTALPAAGAPGAEAWTCSMHPQVRLPGPGACPICSMPLVPTGTDAGAAPDVVSLDPDAVRSARIETGTVQRAPMTVRIRSVGVVGADENRIATIPSRVSGFLERLYVGAVGLPVRRGDHLAEIYSPELVIAQQELVAARDQAVGRAVAEAARIRLRRFGISDEQIDAVTGTGQVMERLVLTAPVDGVVIEEMVALQAPVEAGMVLYRIADLRTVWVTLAVHEDELPFIRVGQSVEIRVDALPGESVAGRVAVVEPVLDTETRTARARVVVGNESASLKPGMFAHASIQVPLRDDATPGPTGVEGRWTCPMHPEVLADAAGACPRCGMPLERVPGEPSAADGRPLSVPASAVLPMGTRTIVYREREPGTYEPVQVELGPRADDRVAVRSGLAEGDRVAIRGAFLLDSEAQIRGLPSLLRPEGGGPPAGHQHGGAPSERTPGPSRGSPSAPAVPSAGHQH